MKISTAVMVSAATVATAGALGIASAAIAAADQAADSNTHELGTRATLTNGDVVQGWTVSNLQQSTDTIPYTPNGTLWEATASDEAVQGAVIPIVSNLNARTASGQTYRALYQVATPQGVNPATIDQGQKTTGKIYFDVTGDNPNSVVYNASGNDLATWVQPPPAGGSSSSAATGRSSSPAAVGGSTTAAPAGAEQTPAGTPTTPLPAGRQGTPIPEGRQGTPIPAGTGETPADAPQAPVPTGTEGAPANVPESPAPAPRDGTPAGTPPQSGSAGTEQAPVGTEQAPAGTPQKPASGSPPATVPDSGGAPAS